MFLGKMFATVDYALNDEHRFTKTRMPVLCSFVAMEVVPSK